jgi:hypothetical protein
MRRRDVLPVVLALAGLAAVVLAARTQLITVRPAYDGRLLSVTAGMGQLIGHEERLLIGVAGLGVVGALGAAVWHRVALLTQAAGGVVLVFVGRAVRFQLNSFDVYVGVPLFDGASGPVLFGPAAYLFVLGGLLFVGAGVVGYDAPAPRTTRPVASDDRPA